MVHAFTLFFIKCPTVPYGIEFLELLPQPYTVTEELRYPSLSLSSDSSQILFKFLSGSSFYLVSCLQLLTLSLLMVGRSL